MIHSIQILPKIRNTNESGSKNRNIPTLTSLREEGEGRGGIWARGPLTQQELTADWKKHLENNRPPKKTNWFPSSMHEHSAKVARKFYKGQHMYSVLILCVPFYQLQNISLVYRNITFVNRKRPLLFVLKQTPKTLVIFFSFLRLSSALCYTTIMLQCFYFAPQYRITLLWYILYKAPLTLAICKKLACLLRTR
jgi:hypothetical protein